MRTHNPWIHIIFPLLAVAAMMAVGCLDYDLDQTWEEVPPPGLDDPEDPDDPYEVAEPDDEEVAIPTDEPDELEPPEEEPPEEEELPDCDDTVMADWQWYGSMPFEHSDDLEDMDGRPYFDMDFVMVDFSTVSIPDEGHTPSGYDRVYRAEFYLGELPPALFLSMQSDDGITFYLNGQEVGQWGGTWQEEGCVNDNAGCSESVVVPPVDVTSFLDIGTNVAAARVSNPIDNSYFEVYTECVD